MMAYTEARSRILPSTPTHTPGYVCSAADVENRAIARASSRKNRGMVSSLNMKARRF